MEQQSKSFFPRLMSIIFIAMGVFLGIYAFFANATTWTLPLGSGWNNMTSYIDSTFWNNNPTDYDIVTALYGTGDEGSIYTQHRTGYTSGSCLNAGMSVEYFPDFSTLPLQLADNTIYVLTGNVRYTTTGTISFGNCSSLISKNSSPLLSTGQLTSILDSSSKNFLILDNVKINGEDDGEGGTHDYNPNGLRTYDTQNMTINNVSFLKNGTAPMSACGIHMTNSNYFHIMNTEVYHDKDHGISIDNSHHNLVEQSSFYNNGVNGILLSGSNYNVFNNIKVYNNNNEGILMTYYSQYNTFNNTTTYNNGNAGISLSYSSNNTFNNTISANNTSYGFDLQHSNGITFHNIIINNNFPGATQNNTSHTTYYGDIYLINNTDTLGNLDDNLSISYFSKGSYNASLGWNTGAIITGKNTWSYLINPQSSTTEYLLARNTNFASLRGFKPSRNGLYTPITYSYGGSIFKQIQPVMYNDGFALITGLTFDNTKFIGGDQDYISGYIVTQSTNTGTIHIYSSISTYYKLFGTGLTNEYSGYLVTGSNTLNITFSGGEGIKPVIVQLGSGTNRATHYGSYITYDFGDPIFTGTTLSGDIVHNGGYYNTGITIIFYEPNLSGVTLSGLNNLYFSGAFANGGVINATGTHQFTIYDTVGHITGMVFTIDTESPTLTGAINGSYNNTDVIITGIDTVGFSGFRVNGVWYPGISLLLTGEGIYSITGYDLANNTINQTLTIDKTAPTFTGTTIVSLTHVVSGGYYHEDIAIEINDVYMSGATINGTPIFSPYMHLVDTTGTFILFAEDLAGNTTGMTFTIDKTNPSATAIYPYTGLNITGTTNITFLRTGLDANISGYTLYVGSTGYTTTNTGYTINNMNNGTYTRYVLATDLAGNTGASAMATFRISTPLTGTATLTGGNMIQIGSTRYTRLDATFALRANQPCRYTITGTYLDTFSGDYLSDMTLSRSLTGSDGDKTVYITFSTGAEIPVTISKTIKLDTTAYAPTLLSPLTGASVGGTVDLRWNHSSTPESVGRSGYRYYLSYTGAFSSLIASGTVADTATGVSISSGFTSTGTVYRYVEAFDKLGNTSGSAISSFMYDTTADITPNSFSFNDVTDARLDRVYVSNTLTITGMASGVNVLASINRGALYISGVFVGTTGYIQNGRTVKIELTSSDDYDETISSTLTINSISDTFSVTTMEEDEDNGDDYEDIETNLSNTEKLMIISVFETLRDLYAGDKEEEFFNTFLVMLENKMDDFDENDSEYDALKYLHDLVEQYYENGEFGDNVTTTAWIVNGIYTAPNGKKYAITYDSSKQRFTSTNFVVPKYFPTLDTLKYIIDINNPVGSKYANAKAILARWKNASIDGTRQSAPYTAPNRKAFYFFKTIDERYSSYTFTSERYFNSLLDVKEFINSTNR